MLHKHPHFLPFFTRWRLLNSWNSGVIIDGKNRLSLKHSFRHVLVTAPSGGGKSSIYCLPNALALNGRCSAIFTDPSGELYTVSHKALRRRNYTVIRLDFRPEHRAYQYNPLRHVTNAVQAQKTADILIDAAYPIRGHDTFWTDSAKAFLGLLLNLLHLDTDTDRTLFTLCEWLFVLSTLPSTLDRKALSVLPPIQQKSYQAFWAQDSKVIAGILSTCKTALGKMTNDPHLAWITQRSTVDFSLLRTHPIVLFIIVPEKDIQYFNFVLSLLFRDLFNTCIDPPKKRMPYRPILFFVDEAGQFCIPELPSYINIARKYQVSVSLIVQELSQLRTLYGSNQAESIIHGGISNHVFFPGLSPTTTTQLEQMLGHHLHHGRMVPFLPRHTLRTLPKHRGVFISGNHRPVLLRMRPWYRSLVLRWRARKSR